MEVLEHKHQEALAASEVLKKECADLATKLERADKLVGGLSGERERWLRDIAKFEQDILNLVGDCVLAAAFLAYAGPFTSEFRVRVPPLPPPPPPLLLCLTCASIGLGCIARTPTEGTRTINEPHDFTSPAPNIP